MTPLLQGSSKELFQGFDVFFQSCTTFFLCHHCIDISGFKHSHLHIKLSLIDFQTITLEILSKTDSSPQHTVIIDPKSMREVIIFPVAH